MKYPTSHRAKLLTPLMALPFLLTACTGTSSDALRVQAETEMKAAHFEEAETHLNRALIMDQSGSAENQSGTVSDLISRTAQRSERQACSSRCEL